EIADLNIAEHHQETARQQARAHTLDTLLAGLDVLTTTKSRLRTSAHGQVLLEMAVVRLSRLDELIPLSQLAQSISHSDAETAAPARSTAAPTSTASSGGNGSKKNGTTGLPEAVQAVANGVRAPPETAPAAVPIGDANLLQVWDKVKFDLGAMFAGQLARAGLPAIVGPKTLVLRFPNQYNHAYDYCRDPGRAQHVEGVLKRLSGQ